MDSSREQIEEIKSRLDIVDIIGKYVKLKQAGKNYSGLCPFHSEKTPSFIVSPELQRYKCFGCGEAGDIFNFVQQIENIDFPEALEKLAKEAGIKLKKSGGNTIYKRLEEINKLAAIHFFNQLKKNDNALDYLHKRGVRNQSIKNFGIGYAPGDSKLLSSIQKTSKYSKKELFLSGLFVERQGKLRSKFFRRIMFPIRSTSGRIIAFTGRVLPNNKYGPKYMNSPETPIYRKKENLYGQYEARQEIRKQDLVIICEGSTDVISAHQSNIKNIVAPLGTAITSEQLEKISRLTKNVLFLFDSDEAGQKALEKAFVLSQPLSLNTYASNTQPYKDLDELIQKEPEKLKNIVEMKVDAYSYLLTEYIKEKDLNDFEDYQKIVSWMQNMLKAVNNKALLDFYVKMGFKITKVGPSKNPSKRRFVGVVEKNSQKSLVRKDKQTTFLQNLLFQSDITLPKNIELKFFTQEAIRGILKYIKDNPKSSREDILKHFDQDPKVKATLEESIFSFFEEESSDKEIQNIYVNITKEYFKNQESLFNTRIAAAEVRKNSKESDRLLKKFQELTKERKKYEENS